MNILPPTIIRVQAMYHDEDGQPRYIWISVRIDKVSMCSDPQNEHDHGIAVIDTQHTAIEKGFHELYSAFRAYARFSTLAHIN